MSEESEPELNRKAPKRMVLHYPSLRKTYGQHKSAYASLLDNILGNRTGEFNFFFQFFNCSCRNADARKCNLKPILDISPGTTH